MSVLIRRVACPNAATTPVIPPDGKDRTAALAWQVINPTGSGGSVELVDTSTKTIGGGLPVAAGATPVPFTGSGVKVWAANNSGSAITVIVVGTPQE